MKKGISKPVVLIVVLGLALTLAIIWQGRPGPVAPASIETPVAVPTEGAAPPTPGVAQTQIQPSSTNDTLSFQTLELWVQTSEGQPLPEAKIRAAFRTQNAEGPSVTNDFITGPTGFARVAYPQSDLQQLEVTASHEDYIARKLNWDLHAGDVVPASYLLKLAGGVTIGGTVVDTTDMPISGAKLSFHRFWRAGEDMPPRGEQSDFSSRDITTNSRGGWQLKGLPKDLLGHIGFNVEHPGFMSTTITVGTDPAIETQLRAGTFKVVLHAFLMVRGLVIDQANAPVAGATVWAGHRNFGDRQESRSDADGHFSFRNIAEGDVLFSTMASGRKPESKTFRVRPDMPEIVFRLEPGKVVRALVQNGAGEPLPDVRVALESYSAIGRTYEFSTNTGPDGRFEWHSAPDEPMQFRFSKSGYAQLNNKVLKPDFDNIVTLHEPRKVEGLVLDADSGQPITQFKVGKGRYFGPDQFYVDSPGTGDYSDANGQFTLSFDEEEQNGIRVAADDHSETTQKLPEAQRGVIKMEFRLKPSAALRGTVVTADGAPVPGVQVALVKEGIGADHSVSLNNWRFQTSGGTAKLVTTDGSGQFTLQSPPESGGKVVAVGELGFGSATVDQIRASGLLVLQGFGQIEGILKIAGAPAAGQELLFTLGNIGVMTDFQSFKTQTDGEGKFKFDKVPAGEGQLVRLIKTTPNSWLHSHTTTVNIQPGQTTFVTLGDSGAIIRGRVRLETPPTDEEQFTINGYLHTAMPDRPSFSSPAEAQAFYGSAEWKARIKDQKHFGVVVNPDGSFMVDSVPPGDYTLSLSANKGSDGPFQSRPIASRTITVSVPDDASPQTPIEMGEITLPPAAR